MRSYGKSKIEALIPPWLENGAWARGDAYGKPVVLTWSVAPGWVPPRQPPDERLVQNYVQPRSDEIQMFRKAIKELNKVSGLTLVEVKGVADIGLRVFTDGFLLGWANTLAADAGSDVALRRLDETPGGRAAWLESALRGLGHAVGLDDPSLNRRLPARLDDTGHTVMSHTREGGFKSSYRPLDVAALQTLYGAPTDIDARVIKNRLVVFGGDGDDELHMSWDRRSNFGGKSEAMHGLAGDDVLTAEDDSHGALFGGEGADRLSVADGRGAMFLRGGAGEDRLTTRRATADLRGDGGDDVLVSRVKIGSPELRGGAGDDRLIGGRSDAGDRIWGGAGDDLLRGGGGHRDFLFGGRGDDKFVGGVGGSRLFGGAGDDVFKLKLGVSRADGGGGDDRIVGRGDYTGGPGDDVLITTDYHGDLFGGGGDDRLTGSAGPSKLLGGSGRDRLDGGDGNDRMRGGPGQDELFGGAGDDEMNGGPGADRLNGGPGADTIFGGAGDDVLYVAGGRATLHGGGGDDRLGAGLGAATLYGGNGSDRLEGGGERAFLDGGFGHDVLIAGVGAIFMIGDDGRDIFVPGFDGRPDRFAFDPEDDLIALPAAARTADIRVEEADNQLRLVVDEVAVAEIFVIDEPDDFDLDRIIFTDDPGW